MSSDRASLTSLLIFESVIHSSEESTVSAEMSHLRFCWIASSNFAEVNRRYTIRWVHGGHDGRSGLRYLAIRYLGFRGHVVRSKYQLTLHTFEMWLMCTLRCDILCSSWILYFRTSCTLCVERPFGLEPAKLTVAHYYVRDTLVVTR